MEIPEHLRITRITTVTEVTNAPEELDRRYRITVNLHRSDRPKYWVYSCSNCKSDVVEINNSDIVSETDVFDASQSLVGRRCPGQYCKRWYYFNLSS